MQAVSRGFLGACASRNKSLARIYGKGMDCTATDSCQWDFWPWNKHGSRAKAQKEMFISCQSLCLVFFGCLALCLGFCLFVCCLGFFCCFLPGSPCMDFENLDVFSVEILPIFLPMRLFSLQPPCLPPAAGSALGKDRYKAHEYNFLPTQMR